MLGSICLNKTQDPEKELLMWIKNIERRQCLDNVGNELLDLLIVLQKAQAPEKDKAEVSVLATYVLTGVWNGWGPCPTDVRAETEQIKEEMRKKGFFACVNQEQKNLTQIGRAHV